MAIKSSGEQELFLNAVYNFKKAAGYLLNSQ